MPASFDNQTTDEIGSYFSDYYKEVWGCRPRFVSFNDREALIEAALDLERYMAIRKSTKEGRNELREEGWYIEEYMEEDGWDQAAYKQREEWCYQEMDREMAEWYKVPEKDPEDNIIDMAMSWITRKWILA